MKKRVIVKGIINYIFAMVFAIIFGLFLNANVGWFIVLTLLLAPFLSVFLAWLASRNVSLSSEMEEALLSKGDTCTMQICVRNRSIFPTPPLEVQLTNEAGVRSEKPRLLVSVLPKASKEFEVIFGAKICGMSIVGIESVRVTDYLGLFSFSLKNADYEALQRKVAVIPDMAEISARDDNLVKVMQTSLQAEDSEDTVEASVHTFGGFPGYDNREYVPGDPIKRINWKQSAKRDKLLVRLDDEMASRTVNVVLDSVFQKETVDIRLVSMLPPYRELKADEILPKIAEDAVENALGIMRVLIRHGYTIHFYAMMEEAFCRYEIADELDLEAVRLELAYYRFREEANVARVPREDSAFQDKVSLFSTPNRYEEACAALEGQTDAFYTNIYSVLEEARKLGGKDNLLTLGSFVQKKMEKPKLGQRITSMVAPLVIPYLLALLLSIAVFGVFDVPVLSYWTLAQAVASGGIVAFCEFVRRHRLLGTFWMVLFIMGDLYMAAKLAFGNGLLNYMYWFMSGGSEIQSTSSYLLSLLLVFTVFFAMVVFYFARVLYRTSFLMLVSLIPFVIYVKVMLDIDMTKVVFVTVLNVAAFLVNTRTGRDAGKRIVGYKSGLLSFGFYALLFVLIGLAVPDVETKYYYMFENAFLGGNVSEKLPQEYSEMSEYSGNADGFNEMNNRKLYVITAVEQGANLYLKRQTFDLYDFKNDRWYGLETYSEPVYSLEQWAKDQNYKNLYLLTESLRCAAEYEPKLLSAYGLEEVPTLEDSRELISIEATNFANVAYVVPQGTIRVTTLRNDTGAMENSGVSLMGVFQRIDDFLDKDIAYAVEYYDEEFSRNRWVAAGGANYDRETALSMLQEAEAILWEKNELEYAETISRYIDENQEAMIYQLACEENTNQIPNRVKELALEITQNCTYDWEKAEALQRYFRENGFVYDLEYDAPDDSVEYFLFEGKTGTCSDYASAYVLMARAAGLTARYVEGFVPEAEYNGDYVVRTNCGHAYAEVYIPNVGYVVYEATMPASYGTTGNYGSGMSGYILTVIFRIFYVFALVSVIIVMILFVNMVAAPHIREWYFQHKVKVATPGFAIRMLYQRLQQRHAKGVISMGGICTPYEYAEKFEGLVGYDISELTYMVEKAAYEEVFLGEEQKKRAQEIYQGARQAIRQWKKQKNQKK